MNNQISGYKLIIYYIGLFLIAIGFIILLPLLMLIFYHNEINYAYCFLIPGIITIFLGYLINFFFKKKKPVNLENHQDVVLVVLIWIILT